MILKRKICAGCGANPQSDPIWINVDKYDTTFQDCLHDLEVTPWPWEDNSVDEMLWNHSMEHVGQDPQVFLKIMQEIYRVSCNNAIMQVNAPHIRHDDYWGDPTHCRPITANMFLLFSKAANQRFRDRGSADSCLAFQLGVDFEVIAHESVLDERFAHLNSDPSWLKIAAVQNNVIRETRIRLRVIKENV